MRPYFSVLIDTYNHGRFIEDAVESVLAQDFPLPEMEIFVVDDGSTDDTAARVHKFGNLVRYLHKPNGGQASAFNFGIPQTQGQIVAFLDGDDTWTKEKLRVLAETFAKHPEVGAVGHGLYQMDARGNILGTVVPDRTYYLAVRTVKDAQQFDRLKGFFGTSKVAYRRSLLDRILPVPEELVFEADEFVWTLAAALSEVIALDLPLFCYRFHDANLFMASGNDRQRARRKYDVLAALLRHLPARLDALGIAPDVRDALVYSLRVETDRLRLELDGGSRWEMFANERAANRLAYRDEGVGYRLFKGLVLGLTLILPPQQFSRLKRWYSARDLRRLRRLVGEPVSAVPVIERKVST